MKNKKQEGKKQGKSKAGLYFLVVVMLAYLIILIMNKSLFIESLRFFLSLLWKIALVFIGIFVLMVIIEHFVKTERIIKYFGKDAGIKGWLFAIVAGIISTGPMYLWYPLLQNMQKNKASNKFIAVFLYNRSVKVPLLPLMIYYFGLAYTIILAAMMIAASIVQGLIVDRLMKV